MYKVKDNAEAQLQFGISSVATTLVVKEGQGSVFPNAPFLVVLNKRNSDGEVTKSEKIEVTAKNGDQLTVKRGFEGTTPSDFSADDFVSLFVLAKHIEQLQDEVEKKAEQTELDSATEKISTLEEKVESSEEKIEKLESKQANAFKGMYFCFDEIESGKQLGYIRELKPENCNKIDYVGFFNVNNTKRRFFCWVSDLTITDITLKLGYNGTLQYDLILRLLDEETGEKIHPNAEFVFSRGKMNNANGQLLVSEHKTPFTIDKKYLNKRIIVELDMSGEMHTTNYWRVYCSDVLNYQWYKAKYNNIATIEDNDTLDKMRERGFVFSGGNSSFVDRGGVNCYCIEGSDGGYATHKLEYPVNLNGDFDIEIYATCALGGYNDGSPIGGSQGGGMGIMNADNSSWLVYCDPKTKQITTSAGGSISYTSWAHDYEPRIRRFKRSGGKIKVWHMGIYLGEMNCNNGTTGKFVQTRDRRGYNVKGRMYFGSIRHYAGFGTFGYSLPYISADFITKSGIALAKGDMNKIIGPLLYPTETTTHSKLCEFILYGAVPHSFPLGMVYDFNDGVLSNSYSTILNRSVLVGQDNFFEGKNHLHLGQTATSATTGSIPPGNFKGYLNASLPNGEEIKIPYYGK